MKYICRYCGAVEDDPNEVEMDQYKKGFWCGNCDGYTALESKTWHKFTMILEEKAGNKTPSPNVKVKFDKRLSPLRYPGGKSKLTPLIYSKLQNFKSKTLVGAFAGGASVELALLKCGAVEHLVLNDLDIGIYALFWTIKHAPDELLFRIQSRLPTHDDFLEAQSKVKSDYRGCTIFEAAWCTLLVNRLAYSGIYYANALGGRNGTQEALLSRWNPKNLCYRVQQIHHLSERITVYNRDACELIEEMYWHPETTIFVDPPYFQKGEDLYRRYYQKDDHIRLSCLLDSLHQGMPGADIILFYDNDTFIDQLYEYPDEVEIIGRSYSI